MEEKKEMDETVLKELCICVPTYHREKAIERFLHEELALLQKHNVDLFICDSNEDDKTLKIVSQYKQSGFINLRYKKFDSEMNPSKKVYHIFRAASKSDYKYIWLIHDHTVFCEEALIFILRSLKENCDFYVLNMQSDQYGREKFQDINDFLIKCAWRLNSYGASILNTQTFLRGIDWQRYSRKYNSKKTWNYSHIGLYFERAAEMRPFQGCQLFFDRKVFLDFLRAEKPSWNNDILRICLECWGNVIMMLPDIYHNKTEVLRSQDRWFLSKYSMLIYKKNGGYKLNDFLKYERWIRKIYPEDYIRDFLIAVLPYKLLKRLYNRELYRQIEDLKKEKGMLYIFGAGRHGMECASYLRELGIQYDGFLVSNLEGNPNILDNHIVYNVEERLKQGKCLVLVAVLSSGVEAVEKKLNYLKENMNGSIKSIVF